MTDPSVPVRYTGITTVSGDPDLDRYLGLDRLGWWSNRNLRRVALCAPADHLEQAAALLRERPTIDGHMLAANRTAQILGVLRLGADQLGAPLGAATTAAAIELRHWAVTVKLHLAEATQVVDPHRNP